MAQTNINDFHIISKIGTHSSTPHVKYFVSYLGSGAFSEVFKVSRKSDGKEYALKKVWITYSMVTDIGVG